jgi:DNA-binding NarL/FixJ family response regulator
MNTKVMIAFSNMIYSEGVKKLLEGAADPEVADVFITSGLKTGTNPYGMIKSFEPDVILVDFITLYNEFGDVGQARGMRLVLLDTGCGEDNITSAVTDKGLKGVLAGNATPLILKKAISSVARGGVWFSRIGLV